MQLKSFVYSLLFILIFQSSNLRGQNERFNGLNMNMGNLYRLSNAETRSISPENFTGEKGKGGMAIPDPEAPRNTANASLAARDLGQGWKVNPFIIIKPGETITLAEIDGPGAIQHIWMTPTGNWRFSIVRIYWDDEESPSVEVLADAFSEEMPDYDGKYQRPGRDAALLSNRLHTYRGA